MFSTRQLGWQLPMTGMARMAGLCPGFRSRDFYLLINDIQKTLLGFAAPNRVPVCSREFCVVQQQVELAGGRGTVDNPAISHTWHQSRFSDPESIVAHYRRWNRDSAIEYAMSSSPDNSSTNTNTNNGGNGGANTGGSGGAVVQRVIREVGGGTSYPTLTKTNYSDWAALMKVKLMARALWAAVDPGGVDPQEDMMALDVLASAVLSEMVAAIANKETAKDAWDAIKTMRVGDDRMRKSTAQHLRRQFDLATSRVAWCAGALIERWEKGTTRWAAMGLVRGLRPIAVERSSTKAQLQYGPAFSAESMNARPIQPTAIGLSHCFGRS